MSVRFATAACGFIAAPPRLARRLDLIVEGCGGESSKSERRLASRGLSGGHCQSPALMGGEVYGLSRISPPIWVIPG